VPSTIIYQEPAGDGTTYVHRLHEVGPRAWLVSQAEINDETTILHKIADPNFNRWQTALLEAGAEPFMTTLHSPPSTPHPSRITFHTPQSLSVQVKTDTPALLILSEPHYPGWQATIDGQSAPVLRAYYTLRAVPLPAGEHTVTFSFRPFSFTLGAIISTVTLIVVSLVLILSTKPLITRSS
jgi:hypothetical protein